MRPPPSTSEGLADSLPGLFMLRVGGLRDSSRMGSEVGVWSCNFARFGVATWRMRERCLIEVGEVPILVVGSRCCTDGGGESRKSRKSFEATQSKTSSNSHRPPFWTEYGSSNKNTPDNHRGRWFGVTQLRRFVPCRLRPWTSSQRQRPHPRSVPSHASNPKGHSQCSSVQGFHSPPPHTRFGT